MGADLATGTVFAGRYRVIGRIAAGAMGAVYEVQHLETQRRRALKVMLAHALENDDLRERFKLEARVAAQVESDFIVDVFDAGVDDETGMPFLVMELLRGEELGKRLKRLGRLGAEETVVYLHQTALALDKTHRASIVHRDLKPGNLFLTEQDDGSRRIKILDFGVAKIMGEGALVSTATVSVGTPFYMAPEQFLNAGVSPAADVFALGMIAYTLLVGVPYWIDEMRGGTPAVVFATIAAKGPPEAATARAARRSVTLPPAFDGWFSRVTATDPSVRFPSATAAVAALAESLGVPLPDARGEASGARSGSGVSASTSHASASRASGSQPSARAHEQDAHDATVREAAVARSAEVPAPRATARPLVLGIGVAAIAAFGIGGYLAVQGLAARSAAPPGSLPEPTPSAQAAEPRARAPSAMASGVPSGAPSVTPSGSPSVTPSVTPSASVAASASAARSKPEPRARPAVPAPQPPKSLYRRD